MMSPRLAHRVSGETVVDIAAEDIVVGDTLLLRPGELVPCDAEVVDGRSHVDASRLTGEPMPVRAETGVPLMSGSVNQEGSLTLTATALSRDGQHLVYSVPDAHTGRVRTEVVRRLATTPTAWIWSLGGVWDVARDGRHLLRNVDDRFLAMEPGAIDGDPRLCAAFVSPVASIRTGFLAIAWLDFDLDGDLDFFAPNPY